MALPRTSCRRGLYNTATAFSRHNSTAFMTMCCEVEVRELALAQFSNVPCALIFTMCASASMPMAHLVQTQPVHNLPALHSILPRHCIDTSRAAHVQTPLHATVVVPCMDAFCMTVCHTALPLDGVLSYHAHFMKLSVCSPPHSLLGPCCVAYFSCIIHTSINIPNLALLVGTQTHHKPLLLCKCGFELTNSLTVCA